MKKSNEPTFRKLQTIEALARLARLGERSSRPDVYFAAMTTLMNGEVYILTNHDPSVIPRYDLEQNVIRQLEEKANIKIYLAHHSENPEELISSYFFVGPDLAEWENERAEIGSGKITRIKQEWTK